MSEKTSRADQVYSCAAAKIEYFASIADTGNGKAVLANLRHGIGKAPGELPELWWVVFEKFPEELTGKKGASPAEWALYTALTLYAFHCQGNDKNAYCKGISLGAAAAGLVKKEEDKERILKRLNLVATADSPEDLAYQLRGIVRLLKSENIALDYARLAKELYIFDSNFGSNSERANSIKLNWGRDFYGNLYKKGENSNG